MRIRLAYRTAAYALTIALLSTGCGIGEESPHSLPNRNMILPADFVNTGDQLQIRYSVSNDYSRPLILLDEIPNSDTPGARDFDINAVFLRPNGSDSGTLFKSLPPPPKGIRKSIAVRGTLLESRHSTSRVITIPLPLKPRLPYGEKIQPSKPIDKACLCIDFAEVDKVKIEPGGDPRHPVVTKDATSEQYALCTPTVVIADLPATPPTDSPLGPWPSASASTEQ